MCEALLALENIHIHGGSDLTDTGHSRQAWHHGDLGGRAEGTRVSIATVVPSPFVKDCEGGIVPAGQEQHARW